MTTQALEREIASKLALLQKNDIKIVSLINKDPLAINVALNSVNIADKELAFPVFIVDETLCRGLDVKSSAFIEQNGGIYVIVAKLPSSRKVMFQAIGRT